MHLQHYLNYHHLLIDCEKNEKQKRNLIKKKEPNNKKRKLN